MQSEDWKELVIIKKTTKVYELRFTKNEVVEPITDWTIYFTVKKNMKDLDDNAKIKKDVIDHEDAVGGITLIKLSASDTNIEAGVYYYDIKYKDSDGNIGILFMGRIKVTEPVTQRI